MGKMSSKSAREETGKLEVEEKTTRKSDAASETGSPASDARKPQKPITLDDLRAEVQAKQEDPSLTEEEKDEIRKEYEAKELEILSKRYSKADFEPLIVIGRGAFGEVSA